MVLSKLVWKTDTFEDGEIVGAKLSVIKDYNGNDLETEDLPDSPLSFDEAIKQKTLPPTPSPRPRGRPPKGSKPLGEASPLVEASPPILTDTLIGHGGGLPMSMMPQPPPGVLPAGLIVANPSPQVPVVAGPAGVHHAARLGEVFLDTAPPEPPCPWFKPHGITQEEVDELKVAFPSLTVMGHVDETDKHNLVYITLRNTLIDVYRANPTQRLTLAECRKHCDGDLAALLRVLSFLERNRLVNFALTYQHASLQSSHPVYSSKGKDSLAQFWSTSPTCLGCDRICLYSFYVISPSIYQSSIPLPQLKIALWCSECARETPYNQILTKVSIPALHCSALASWSERQINALFDAIEANSTDWVEISKAVSDIPGNPMRSPKECLAVFLATPIAAPPPKTSSVPSLQVTEHATRLLKDTIDILGLNANEFERQILAKIRTNLRTKPS